MGSHLDVVPAQVKGWDLDSFKLFIEGNDLYGRGTTDCLDYWDRCEQAALTCS